MHPTNYQTVDSICIADFDILLVCRIRAAYYLMSRPFLISGCGKLEERNLLLVLIFS